MAKQTSSKSNQTVFAHIAAVHTQAVELVDTFTTTPADQPADLLYKSISLHSIASNKIGKVVASLATDHIASGMAPAATAKNLAALLLAWGRAVSKDKDAATIKQIKNARQYAARLVEKSTGQKLAYDSETDSYKVTAVEAKPKVAPVTAAGKGKGAAVDGVTVSQTGAGLVANGESVSVSDAMQVIGTAELLAELARRFDSAAELVAAVESLPVALFKATKAAAGSDNTPAPTRSPRKTARSGKKRAAAAGLVAVPTLADLAPAELAELAESELVAELRHSLVG